MSSCCPTCGRPELKTRRKRWDQKSIGIAIYQHVYDHGRPPRYTDWQRADPDGLRPTSQAVADHFGTFAQALRANGYRPGRSSPVRHRPVVYA